MPNFFDPSLGPENNPGIGHPRVICHVCGQSTFNVVGRYAMHRIDGPLPYGKRPVCEGSGQAVPKKNPFDLASLGAGLVVGGVLGSRTGRRVLGAGADVGTAYVERHAKKVREREVKTNPYGRVIAEGLLGGVAYGLSTEIFRHGLRAVKKNPGKILKRDVDAAEREWAAANQRYGPENLATVSALSRYQEVKAAYETQKQGRRAPLASHVKASALARGLPWSLEGKTVSLNTSASRTNPRRVEGIVVGVEGSPQALYVRVRTSTGGELSFQWDEVWLKRMDFRVGNPLTGVEAHGLIESGLRNLTEARRTTVPTHAAYRAGKAVARGSAVSKHGPIVMKFQAERLADDARRVRDAANAIQRASNPSTPMFSSLDQADAFAWAMRSQGYRAAVVGDFAPFEVQTDAPRQVVSTALDRLSGKRRKNPSTHRIVATASGTAHLVPGLASQVPGEPRRALCGRTIVGANAPIQHYCVPCFDLHTQVGPSPWRRPNPGMVPLMMVGNRRRRNPQDEEMRALERAAAAGDSLAAAKLQRMQGRTGEIGTIESVTLRGEWNLVLRKSGSRWDYFLQNPQGGGGGSGSYKSMKAAVDAAIGRGVVSHQPITGKERVYVIQAEWSPSAEDYVVTKKPHFLPLRVLPPPKPLRPGSDDYFERLTRGNPPTLADSAEHWASRRGLRVPARGSAAWQGMYSAWQRSGMKQNPGSTIVASFNGPGGEWHVRETGYKGQYFIYERRPGNDPARPEWSEWIRSADYPGFYGIRDGKRIAKMLAEGRRKNPGPFVPLMMVGNPGDASLRDLERAAKQGDVTALERLAQEAARRSDYALAETAHKIASRMIDDINFFSYSTTTREAMRIRKAAAVAYDAGRDARNRRPNPARRRRNDSRQETPEEREFRLKLPSDRVLGTLTLEEARRRWAGKNQVPFCEAAFRDFHKTDPGPEVVIYDDGKKDYTFAWTSGESPEVTYSGGTDKVPDGSVKADAIYVHKTNENDKTGKQNKVPKPTYLLGLAPKDGDPRRPVTKDFMLVGHMTAQRGWLRR